MSAPRVIRALLALALTTGLSGAAAAQRSYDPIQRYDPTQDIGIDQRLGEVVPADIRLVDEAGAEVGFGELFDNERPVVLALVYYECAMLCGLVLEGVLRGLRPLGLDAGSDFTFVAVSIDPREGPELAATKRARMVADYGRAELQGVADGFRLLTGTEEQVDRLARAVGFRFAYDAKVDEYAHAGGLMVLTPERRLSRYFYGVDYAPRDLRLALVEAGDGAVGNLVDQVLILCMHWDPTTGRYGLAIQSVLRIAGVLTVLAIACFVVRDLRGGS
jgi:protein SCO1/2